MFTYLMLFAVSKHHYSWKNMRQFIQVLNHINVLYVEELLEKKVP